jgi:hypothetical protein
MGRPDDPHGDFTAVGNQDFLNHVWSPVLLPQWVWFAVIGIGIGLWVRFRTRY